MNNIDIRNGRCLAKFEPMRVYYNIHRRCWSIQQKDRDSRWMVVGYAQSLVLKDCKLRVSEAGRQRVLASGRKNVHAYVQGYWVPDSQVINTAWSVLDWHRPVIVRYKPSEYRCFHHAGRPVVEAPLVYLPEDRAYLKAWI